MPFCSRAPRRGRPLLAALLLLLALATGAPSSFASASSAPGSGHLDGQPHRWENLDGSEPASRFYTPASGALFVRTASGLKRSDDAGTTWRPVELPPRSPVHNRIVVEVDPADHTVLFANGQAGVYRSTDDAATWTALSLRRSGVASIASIDVSPADRSLVYASTTSGEGAGTTMWLFCSTDRGETWDLLKESQSGPSCAYSVPLFMPHPTDPDRVYRRAGCYRSEPIGDPLYHSADRGATWAEVAGRPIGNAVSLVVGGSSDPRRYYLATRLPGHDGAQGVYRSEDGLGGWTLVLSVPGASIAALAYDQQVPDRVFAGMSIGTVLASTNGGQSWAPIGQPDLDAIRDLALGIDGANLYAATEQGVWRYPLLTGEARSVAAPADESEAGDGACLCP